MSAALSQGDRVVVARCPDEPRLLGQTGRILQPEGRLWLIALDGGATESFPTGTAGLPGGVGPHPGPGDAAGVPRGASAREFLT